MICAAVFRTIPRMANMVAGNYSEKDINDGKPLAAVGYFPLCGMPTFLIPMLAAKENPFAQYHAKQAAVLYIAGFAGGVVVLMINVILGILASVSGVSALGCLGTLLYLPLLGLFVLMVIGIINALQGQAKEIPLLGQYSSKLPF